MGARGIHANEIVVAVKRDPAAGAADGVAVRRGNAPRDPLGGVQGAPAGGNSSEVAAIGLLTWAFGIAGGHVLTHDLAVTAIDVNDRAHAARLWGREYFAHINDQAGVLGPWIIPPAIWTGVEPGRHRACYWLTLRLPPGRRNLQHAPRMHRQRQPNG